MVSGELSRRAVLGALCVSAVQPVFSATNKPGGAITSIAFSPDGKLLAAAQHHEVVLFEVATGKTRRRLHAGAAVVNTVAFTPDGKTLIAGGGLPGRSGELQLWSVVVASRLTRVQHHKDAIYSVSISPNGQRLVAASYDKTLSLWEVDHRKSQIVNPHSLVDHTDAVYAVAFSPDGRLIASASGDRTVKVWDAATEQRLYTLSESTAELYSVAWSPNGRRLAAGGVDKLLRVWNVDARGGSLAKSSFAHDGAVLHVQFMRDGKSLVSSGQDRLVKFWEVETLRERHVLPRCADWPFALALNASTGSERAEQVAMGRYDGVVSVYESAGFALKWQRPGR